MFLVYESHDSLFIIIFLILLVNMIIKLSYLITPYTPLRLGIDLILAFLALAIL